MSRKRRKKAIHCFGVFKEEKKNQEIKKNVRRILLGQEDIALGVQALKGKTKEKYSTAVIQLAI